MTIVRDGNEYELTSEEVFEAYLEELHNADVNELKYWLEGTDADDLTPDIIEKIDLSAYAYEYRRRLDNYDYANQLINEFTQDFITDYILPNERSKS